MYKKEVHPSGAIRCEASERDALALEERARAAGLDVDAPLRATSAEPPATAAATPSF